MGKAMTCDRCGAYYTDSKGFDFELSGNMWHGFGIKVNGAYRNDYDRRLIFPDAMDEIGIDLCPDCLRELSAWLGGVDTGTEPPADADRRIRHLEYLLDNAERKAERRRRHIEACERRNARLNAQIAAERDELLDIARRIGDMPAQLGDCGLRASQLGVIADRIRQAVGGGR